MHWRNPQKEKPELNQIVWVMLYPHKNRGTLKESAPSIQICCGWTCFSSSGNWRVENMDELGLGGISWEPYQDFSMADSIILAWLPLDEMSLPSF